ncbi:ABC transporter substrate-binding protein [Vibrio genomosp. F10]|uniref:Probable sugar-binding periplasmic protein n=2 Tax=Vibrio genomosp. F10 TaxID=723171 RepID=A0A1B9QYR6_9VIBR|nr:ABC transporter substrate-binding protein [Vibrio genomosp. F10]OCH75835.1 sugar ABC transporter substrate-binding protein [Vibrio genomosp. F10]OEE33385.1 sugar ABC transporter substrate-binding protein [Vibrio genomosp. F10 str. ZF-129]OEE93728.1 sugar ABC transporter substrate-binding protein [Vibrio genomosp. F10 str. 9ZC157]OEF05095.1 sugar ABC transporter substrate-binding protein [Vibrio genomosp. F10 str. 9ZB36]OEF23654.1 sugar ABC transporter substrate-binding protein [Vibrio genom
MKYFGKLCLLFAVCFSAVVQSGTLVIESWREDGEIWNNKIIPAFNAVHPNIKVEYKHTVATEYNDQLNGRLAGGNAGDIITCRPFDDSLKLFNDGHLVDLTDVDGMENFPSFAQSAWQTDDGAVTFCLPLASVIHGFFYNKTIFSELGLKEPQTVEEFFMGLDKVKASGKYVPIAMGTKDKWEAATMGFQNVGPNYWNGEDGRFALISGEGKLNDPEYQAVFEQLGRWGTYMGDGYQDRGYTDAIEMFASGKAAVYPAGSWDISAFNSKIDLGVFRPPVKNSGDDCFISDHTDIGIGINANSKNLAEAQTFIDWMSSEEFAGLFTNALPGFFSLSNHFIDVADPTAKTMIAWRDTCDSTIRNSYQILNRGEPSLELEIWETSVGVINGSMMATDAANRLQQGLQGWYKP